jgi:predicted PurR-regulated permease PerM
MRAIFERINQYLFFTVLVVVILYFGRVVLVPVIFASLFAMLFAPMSSRLIRNGWKRSLSTLLCVLIILFTTIGMMAIVGGQIAAFQKDLPKMKQRARETVATTQSYIYEKLKIPPADQKEIVKKQTQSSQGNGKGIVERVLGSITSTIGSFILMLVYTFLMLYNKDQFHSFFLRLYKDEDQQKVHKVVDKIATVSQKYLTGRAMSVLIIATMYAVGLTLVGIKNAILLACIAAMLTLIPYLGTVLGGLFPVVMALATEDSIQPALYAAGVLFFIQTMDNYFIEPNVVGGEVNLNALTSIFSIIVGGLIWGVAGMVLFLPMTAIVKIVCDNVEPLKPFGYLLGEPGAKKPSKIKAWFQEKLGIGKKKQEKIDDQG